MDSMGLFKLQVLQRKTNDLVQLGWSEFVNMDWVIDFYYLHDIGT